MALRTPFAIELTNWLPVSLALMPVTHYILVNYCHLAPSPCSIPPMLPPLPSLPMSVLPLWKSTQRSRRHADGENCNVKLAPQCVQLVLIYTLHYLDSIYIIFDTIPGLLRANFKGIVH